MWANTYRPQTLDEVLGQEKAVRIVRGALKRKKRVGAWLLYGAWGAGKTTIANILAKSSVCVSPSETGEACNQCFECKAFDKDQSVNYSEVDAATFGLVDNIRGLMQQARQAPIGEAPQRVQVLDEAHMLSKPAQNAMLKTLEEGISSSVFILVTTDPQKLLTTIRSRCVQVELTPVDQTSLCTHLKKVCEKEGVEASDKAVEMVVAYTHGHVRDALTKAEEVSLTGPLNEANVRFHLHLEAEEQVGRILRFDQTWEELCEEINSLTRENAPAELWAVTKKTIIGAALANLGNSENLLYKRLVEKFGPRLSLTAEWVMKEASGLSVYTADEWKIALSFVRDKLGAAHVAKKSESLMSGIPKRKQPRRVKQIEMSPEEFIAGLKGEGGE